MPWLLHERSSYRAKLRLSHQQAQAFALIWTTLHITAAALAAAHACVSRHCHARHNPTQLALTDKCVQVLESRIDHTRVVQIIARADHLPLVKDYLLAVQKANLPAVNEAINNLLIEEEVGQDDCF